MQTTPPCTRFFHVTCPSYGGSCLARLTMGAPSFPSGKASRPTKTKHRVTQKNIATARHFYPIFIKGDVPAQRHKANERWKSLHIGLTTVSAPRSLSYLHTSEEVDMLRTLCAVSVACLLAPLSLYAATLESITPSVILRDGSIPPQPNVEIFVFAGD